MTAGVYNEEAGSTILVYKDSALIKSDVLYVLYMSVFLVGVMLLVSLVYVMVSTQSYPCARRLRRGYGYGKSGKSDADDRS